MITLTVNDKELQFEHSLVSLSAWEAEFEKPFYSPTEETKSKLEFDRYFEFMLLNSKHRHLISLLSTDQKIQLTEYMNRPKTATTVKEIQQKAGPRENITSELIYYWLIVFKIPFNPTETWHLNRLLMLVRVCGVKQAPAPKQTKQSKTKLAMSMRELNEKRRKEMGTTG